MPFDPDKYLAQNDKPASSGGFDPDKYLSGSSAKTEVDDTPDGSVDKPFKSDLFGSDTDRMKSSFGDDKGVGRMLVGKGYRDFARNKNGDLVAKDASGQWHQDAQGLSNPINWLEGHAGKALPMAGGMAGGTAATIAGAPSGPGAIATGMAGAGAGGAVGEGARIGIGKALDVYDGGAGDVASDVGTEGALNGVSEGLARVAAPAVKAVGRAVAPVVKPIVDAAEPAVDALRTMGRKAVAKTSSLLSGTPSEAVERLIQRPNEVLGASDPRAAMNTAEKARAELLARDSAEDTAIGKARTDFANNFGTSNVDTTPILQKQNDFLARNAPVNGEEGALSVSQLQDHQDLANQRLMSGGAPQKTARELQNFADYLSSHIKTFEQSRLPGAGDTPDQAQMRRLYGQVKESLHTLDPNGLGAADKQFTQYANNASALGRLENEDSMEGFINNFYGRNKTGMRESAEQVIPNSIDGIKDIAANRAFDVAGPAGHGRGLRNIGTVALESGGIATHNPLMMAAGAALQPQVHKQVIGRAAQAMDYAGSGKMLQMFAEKPWMTQTIGNPELRAQVERYLGTAAQNAPKAAELDSDSSTSAQDKVPSQAPQPIKQNQDQFLQGN